MSFEACQNVTFKKFEVDSCYKEKCPPQFTTQEVCVEYDAEPTVAQAQKDIYVAAEKKSKEMSYLAITSYNGGVEISQSFFSKFFGNVDMINAMAGCVKSEKTGVLFCKPMP